MALSSEDVVAAGLAILREYGLADLTMRRVAERLEVKAGALYWHFPNKQCLLAGISDEVLVPLGEVNANSSSDWLLGWAHRLRAVLLEIQDAAELVASTRAMGLGNRDPVGQAAVNLAERGVAPETAQLATHILWHFVTGHVMAEQMGAQLKRLGGDVGALEVPDFEASLGLLVRGLTAATTTLE